MLYAIFAVAIIVCAFGWLNRWVATAALVKYMLDKGYAAPSDEELKVCCVYVWKKLLRKRS